MRKIFRRREGGKREEIVKIPRAFADVTTSKQSLIIFFRKDFFAKVPQCRYASYLFNLNLLVIAERSATTAAEKGKGFPLSLF